MDIHGIFYVSKAQMIEKVPSDEESEAMETQQSQTENADSNIADAQEGVKDGSQVQNFPTVAPSMYNQCVT